jgi:hypothetical protein
LIVMNGVLDVRLESYRGVNRRLAKLPGEQKSEDAGKQAGKHASDEQGANHDCRPPSRSVAGKAEEVTGIVEPLVNVAATNYRRCALLGADDVQHEQQHETSQNSPRKPFVNGNRDRGRYWAR